MRQTNASSPPPKPRKKGATIGLDSPQNSAPLLCESRTEAGQPSVLEGSPFGGLFGFHVNLQWGLGASKEHSSEVI